MVTTIGIIRHGSTDWNKEGRAQGNSDISLNEEGMAQAKQLAARLMTEQWDIIYTSDLRRAKQTAEIIKESTNVELRFDVRLREMGGGQIEGTTEAERIEKWGVDWRQLDLGLESNEEGLRRGMDCINELAAKHVGKNILIVSHGALIRAILGGMSSHFTCEGVLQNISFTKLRKVDAAWECELYNCTAHIK
ncbi:histidine phosphatase family protein [Paenibacillus sp. OSY-SE]|uniref:histidine phosphatase family protein n=1 Tax=Paenibacillus sp. OSY-SE TaxID=1196323 RepID=UPI0002E63AAD|nr:histidine phosphatase family protein [Paenibacillus sp. OSY-SE]